jgi:hypothetical protein
MNACTDAPIHINWATRSAAAAVLRAAADQVCPSDAIEPRNYLPLAIENDRIRCELLAIAAELDGTNPTSEEVSG